MDKTHHDWAQKVIRGNYHPHVDGLRSLAVLPVLIYHMSMSLCPAGFMGVDVFFVISGYLICGGIMRDLQANSFSLTSFYFRRIRRIFPAYFAVVVITLLVGIALFHWARIVPLAQTALFSALFSTNLYFWLDMGYFQPHAHGNPLLNLWSLGVEEQFYLIIPVALLVLWKVRRTILDPALLVGFIASLALCLLLGELRQSTTAFYILPARGWELLAGALLAVRPPAEKNRWASFLSWVGLALVVFSFWCFSTSKTYNSGGTSVEIIVPFLGTLGVSPFPGWVNLPVIAGSLLLLRHGHAGLVGKLLSSYPLVSIGKISYSLYLWHWPVIVYVRYFNYGHQGLVASMLILAISFAAAWASWRWIEMPVRLSPRFTPQWAFAGTGLGCVLLAGFCLVLVSSNGLRNHLHERANTYASSPRSFMRNFEKLGPKRRDFQPPAYPAIDTEYIHVIGQPDLPPSFCILGDSHAEALFPGLDIVADEFHRTGIYIAQKMDPPFEEGSENKQQRLLAWVARHPDLREIYLVGRWMNLFKIPDGLPQLGDKGCIQPVNMEPRDAQQLEVYFRQAAQMFTLHGKRVFVFSTVPEYGYSPADIMARSQIIPLHYPIEITHQDYRNRQLPIFRIFDLLEKEGLFTVIPLHAGFFASNGSVFMDSSGKPYYKDGDHLTLEGAEYATRKVAPLLWPTP